MLKVTINCSPGCADDKRELGVNLSDIFRVAIQDEVVFINALAYQHRLRRCRLCDRYQTLEVTIKGGD